MVTSTSAEPGPNFTPREATLDTVAAQRAAIDELIDLARHHLQVFDVDLSEGGWQSAARADRLAAFLRRDGKPRIDLIVHDPAWLERHCPRLLGLLRTHSHAMTIYRTGAEARAAMDPLVLADGRHYLHRFHTGHPRAALGIEQPAQARPLVMRFEEIWATGEPGLSATMLGL